MSAKAKLQAAFRIDSKLKKYAKDNVNVISALEDLIDNPDNLDKYQTNFTICNMWVKVKNMLTAGKLEGAVEEPEAPAPAEPTQIVKKKAPHEDSEEEEELPKMKIKEKPKVELQRSMTRTGIEVQVYVKNLVGKTLSVTVDTGEWLDDLKAKVAELDGLAPEKQTLCFSKKMELKPVPDAQALGDCVQHGDVLYARRRQHAAWGEYATAWEQRDPAFLRPVPDIF